MVKEKTPASPSQKKFARLTETTFRIILGPQQTLEGKPPEPGKTLEIRGLQQRVHSVNELCSLFQIIGANGRVVYSCDQAYVIDCVDMSAKISETEKNGKPPLKAAVLSLAK